MSRIVIPYAPRGQQFDMHRGMESKRWSAIVAHRRFGKSVCVVNHLIKQALTTPKRKPFFAYLAPYYNQAKAIAWEYLLYYTSTIPGRSVNRSELSVTLTLPDYGIRENSSTIRIFGADNPDSLRGLYFDGTVMDEFGDMKPEVWDTVLRPALADRQGWGVFIGTPRGRNRFWELYTRGMADPAWFTATYRADETGVLPTSELAALKAQLTESQYAQEFLCSFDVSSDNILIPLQMIDEAVGRNVSYTSAPKVMGVDVGMSMGGDPCAVVIRQGGAIIHIEEWNDDDTIRIAGRVQELVKEHQPAAIYVDCIGWGAGVAHHLAGWGLPCVGINVAEAASANDRFNRKRDELWWKGREFFADKQCCIKETLELQRKFAAELSTPSYSFLPNGKIKVESKDELKKRDVLSPNLADAFILTMAHTEMPPADDYSLVYSGASSRQSSRVL
jgi:hypothetical protein